MKLLNSLPVALCSSLFFSYAHAEFTPCPLLGPRFPAPKSFASSPVFQNGLKELTESLNSYIASQNGDFGLITPNTTSFSIALFSAEESDSPDPYFYEYHHTAPAHGNNKVNANTTYHIGDMTTLFTTWLFLINAGEATWDTPVTKYVPELDGSTTSTHDSLSTIEWNKITLGDLAANLGGIGRYTPMTTEMHSSLASLSLRVNLGNSTSACAVGSPMCTRAEWLEYFKNSAPVAPPATTPVFSNAGFIILAFALESITNRSYSDLLSSTILEPLNMQGTFLQDFGKVSNKSSDNGVAIEAAYSGLQSNIHDMSAALRAILSSELLDPATTHRWLKPVAHTSNRANSVGRPWEIYSLTPSGSSPTIPVYQVRGNIGLSSAHLGLLPDYNVGFVIMATDSQSNADLNAYADLLAVHAVPALEKASIVNANTYFAGTFASGNSSLTIAPTKNTAPGLALTNFTSGKLDLFDTYASLSGIAKESLSIRLYPTGFEEETAKGSRMGFRAIIQDMDAFADAGTPTCDSWRSIDELQLNSVGIDQFVFEVSSEREVYVEAVAFKMLMMKKIAAKSGQS
jgi:CubicO group peptidase (beta-lactamase class C family)